VQPCAVNAYPLERVGNWGNELLSVLTAQFVSTRALEEFFGQGNVGADVLLKV
jgi:hypothetical protein